MKENLPDNPTNMSQDPKKHSLFWFRKGLRIHDNPALIAAIEGASTYRCVYILDPWFAGASQVGINKWRFLLESLEDLDSSLRKLNSRLFVVRGQPADVLPRLFQEWAITCLAFEEDPEPYGKERDSAISAMAREFNVQVIAKSSHTLYDPKLVIAANGNSPPLTYKRFQSVLSTLEPPNQPCETMTARLLHEMTTPVADDHDDRFSVPSLDELGFDTDTLDVAHFRGGESEAVARLHRHLERKAWVASFERPKMSPQSLYPSGTGLSPYLRFGCLSARTFYWKLTELYKKVKKGAEPPLALHGQLLWREFFYTVATNNPNFDRMVGNSICVQIPWEHNPEALVKWAEGMTGFPWIDAIMVQLKKEGWIHHLARHAVACFLTRGDLWISWEEGMKVFDEMLLDADWSVNAGMWMWLSCSAFFQQFFHCYCPVGFGKRADPSGDFVRHYLPVLKAMPTKYIYEPWTAPESVQKVAKCIVGKDYPMPMVVHSDVSRINLERMRQVYKRLVLQSSTSKRMFLDLPKIPKVSMFLSKAKMFLSSSSDDEVSQKQRRRKQVDE
ncbi:cryptochrome-1 [Aplysia californica]|uniref:Cryptochrome-1 n=1 Tax=Aplysia californica TaxID=6500 RepID=A0ABM1A5A1_APLCA|nr:cryptochrome-1 [Aplysia californica]